MLAKGEMVLLRFSIEQEFIWPARALNIEILRLNYMSVQLYGIMMTNKYSDLLPM